MSVVNSPNPNVLSLAEMLANAPNLQQDAVSVFFHKASGQFNALDQFTSAFDPNAGSGGQSSIFCKKKELTKGGSRRVHFPTIGLPAGPGARGVEVLIDRTSTSATNTYYADVDWLRDAVTLNKDQIAHLAPGKSLRAVCMSLLAEKMGIVKQDQMLDRLISHAYDLSTPSNWANGRHRGNVYRVGGHSSIHALTPDDVLDIDATNTSRALLNNMGATPLRKDKSKTGCPVSKYMLLASETAFLNIRNGSMFETARDADYRGAGNANFTGHLLEWQGNSFFEMPVIDHAWDDYAGGPMIAKATVSTEVKPTTATPRLICNANNTLSRYFQWFDGFNFPHSRMETPPDLSSIEYYAWACNPDGSRVFFAYNGGHNGNQITVTKILCPAVSGTTVDTATLGQLNIGASAAFVSDSTGRFTVAGAGANLPTTPWVYTDTIAPGALIIQANSQGTTYTRSFMLGACAGLIAYGSVEMNQIEQTFDFSFVKGEGYEMIYGTGIPLDPLGRPNGYLLIEHAYELVGFRCPAKV